MTSEKLELTRMAVSQKPVLTWDLASLNNTNQ